MRLVSLTQGFEAQVDDEDFERISIYNWYALNTNNITYALTTIKYDKVHLHRFVLRLYDTSTEVDHKDRNGLNCQKSNLRIANRSQNKANSKIPSNNRTGYKGVVWSIKAQKWQATIGFEGKTVWLKYHLTAIDAARAYDKAAKRLFGEFASLNFGGQDA